MEGTQEKTQVFGCPKCNKHVIEQITAGYRVTEVVGITVDEGLLTSGAQFVPKNETTAVYYRCKECKTVLPYTGTEQLVGIISGRGGDLNVKQS